MDKLQPPSALALTGNLAENWRRFKQQFKIYEIASGLARKDGKVRAMTLLHVAGSEALEVYNTFQWDEDEDNTKVEKIMEKFERYCNPRKNLTFERHSFFSRNQLEGESIDAYVTDLRNKASRCEFAELKDGLIRDRIVCGVNSDTVRARLLRESELSLEMCIDICRAAEISSAHLKVLTEEKVVHVVNSSEEPDKSAIKKEEKEYTRAGMAGMNLCQFCGYRHKRGRCPAFGKTCNVCHKQNHFARVCKATTKEVHTVSNASTRDEQPFFIGTIGSKQVGDKDWYVNFQINNCTIPFKIDTGAQCNVMPKSTCDEAGIVTSGSSRSKLVSYSGHEIKTIGKTDVVILYQDRYHVMEVQVVEGDVMPVVGLKTATELNLVKRLFTVGCKGNGGPQPEILKRYQSQFSGIGTLPGEYEIKIDASVTPVVHPPRRIPYMLRDKVKAELDRMARMGIITKVEQPTQWVSPIVVVKKPNGDVRICLDPVDLNKAVKREHYPLRTVEEVAATLAEARVFSTLDATSGFYQIRLAEKSTWLTTFNTPFGRFKFERLPFGLVSAPEIFQRAMTEMFEDIEKCEVIVDDLLVWGKSVEEHDLTLEKVLQRAEETDLRFNEEKCKFHKQEVTYVGHVFGTDGLRPSPDKVQAILNMPAPHDKSSLQRFMGMVNYLHKFIPHLADINKPLRELLEKSVEWHWMERQQKAYEELINSITQAPVLKYFDVSADVTVSVDASSEGLGACLLQGMQPVAYASRALNSAERNYAQIEKEMLAIVFGTNKFHQYIYGKQVSVETDHKPLESLFKKPLSKAPQRIQRMMLRVQHYDLKVNYVPGNQLLIADTLSRASQSESTLSADEFEVHLLIQISKDKADEWKRETDSDPVLSRLREVVLNGWPENRAELAPELREYWNFRDELCICDGLLMKGDRLITPSSLRREMLDKIHSSHLGVEKCINRARETVYWPGVCEQIKEKVAKCEICNKYRNCQMKEPLLPHPVPDRPWQVLAADLFVLPQGKFVVLVDYYSKYFELTQLKDSTSATVINCLQQHMSRHGIPEILYSDNGPEFSSLEFRRFAKAYEFHHVTSSPRFPQSNGLAERTVQTAKKLLKKAYEDKKDPYLAILELRNTPIPGVGLSPTQLLMGRRTRSIIPIKSTLLTPMTYNTKEVQSALTARQQTQKEYFDRSSKTLKPLVPGDTIRMRQGNTWEPAVLVGESKAGEPRSYMVRANNHEYRRNRKDILKTQETLHSELADSADSDRPAEDTRQNESHWELASDSSPTISRVSGRVIRVPTRYRE